MKAWIRFGHLSMARISKVMIVALTASLAWTGPDPKNGIDRGERALARFFDTCIFHANIACAAESKAISLQWEQVMESDLEGWRLYMAQSEAGPFVQTVEFRVNQSVCLDSNAGTYSYEFTFGSPANAVTTYYVYLTAFDMYSNESGPSNTLPVTIDTKAPNVPKLIQILIKVLKK